jgi:hemerythrin-like domain-containing protein
VLSKLQRLERAIDGLDEPDAVLSDLEELGTFFRTWMWALVWKEEDALFLEMVPCSAWQGGAIGEMRSQHAHLRVANERFQKGVGTYLADPGNQDARDQIQESGAHIVQLLRNHFREEDDRLFSLADAHLSVAQERRILTKFERIEADLAWCFENLEAFQP